MNQKPESKKHNQKKTIYPVRKSSIPQGGVRKKRKIIREGFKAPSKFSKGVYKVAVLTISDKCSVGKREDESGKIIADIIKGLPGEVVKYEIIPDEPELIKEKLINYCDSLGLDLVLTNGGTGFTVRDRTPEATKEVIERDVPGIPEAMRTLCLAGTRRAMLSRGIAGIRRKTLILNLPGSSRGAKESLEAILDGLEHGLEMIAEREH